jgi:hypothetical protein
MQKLRSNAPVYEGIFCTNVFPGARQLALVVFRVIFLEEEKVMKEKKLTVPEIGLIAMTRVILGVGIGLLVSRKLNQEQRKGIGWTLLAVGALSTIPIAANVFCERTVGTQVEERAEVAP